MRIAISFLRVNKFDSQAQDSFSPSLTAHPELTDASLIGMTFARIRRTAPLLALLPLATFGLAQSQPQSPSKSAPSDPRIGTLLNTLGETRTPNQAAISPDGKTVAWSVHSSQGYELRLSDVSDPSPVKELTLRPSTDASRCDNDAPAWSPDGQSLAYASTCTSEHNGQPQIFLWSKKSGESRQLTHLTGTIDDIAWSPDGKAIAFLFVENATRSAGALAAMKPWNGVYGEDGVEVQRVAIVTVPEKDTAAPQSPTPSNLPLSSRQAQLDSLFRFVSPSNLHVYEFGWSPDSQQLTYVAANPPGENNWWVAQLYTQSISGSGDQPRSILDTTKTTGSLHNLQIAVPRFSPDGKQIAFIGGLMSDQGSTGGDVYLIPSTGGEPKDITPNRAASVAFIHWLTPETLALSEHVGGSSHITSINVSSGLDIGKINLTLPESIGSGTSVMSLSLSNNQKIAIVRSSYEHAPEVWAGPALQPQTDLPSQRLHQAAVGQDRKRRVDQRRLPRSGLAPLSRQLRSREEISSRRQRPRRSFLRRHTPLARSRLRRCSLLRSRLLRLHAQPARKLRPGRKIHPGQHQGLRLRRPSRRPHRHGRPRSPSPHRQKS